MTYSIDFRQKVLAIRDKENLSMVEVAQRFGIGVRTVMRWTKRIVAIAKRHKPATKVNMDALRQDVEQYPDAYIYERAKRLGVSPSGIWYALKRLNITCKKNPYPSQSRSRKKNSL